MMKQTAKLMPQTNKRYRLITRSDMDGLVCGILLKELDIIDDITFAHPQDMQDGLIEVTEDDITTNLPYVEGVYLAFDHHASEVSRVGGRYSNHVIDSMPHLRHALFMIILGAKSDFQIFQRT